MALAAWRETDQVWSPTMPSIVTPPHFWKASTEALVSGPKLPSMAPGAVVHSEAPLVRGGLQAGDDGAGRALVQGGHRAAVRDGGPGVSRADDAVRHSVAKCRADGPFARRSGLPRRKGGSQ